MPTARPIALANKVALVADDGSNGQFVLCDSSGRIIGILGPGDDAVGRVKITDGTDVALVTAAGELLVSGGGGGTQYAVDTALGATPTGTLGVAIRDDALSALTPVEGDAIGLRVDANGALWTHDDSLDAALAGSEFQVDIVAALPAGTNNIGDVDVLTMPTGASAAQVQGTVAHDGVDAQNPVKIGGKANLDEPTAVADADRVDAWFDQLGRLVVLLGHADPEPPVTANGTAAGLSVIAAPGAGLSLYICKGSVMNAAAAENIISLRDGAAGTIRWTANCPADGGGALFDFGARGWKLTANTALVADIGAATGYINVTEYYIAP